MKLHPSWKASPHWWLVILLLVTIGLIIFAHPLVHLVAPGLYLTADQAAAKGMDTSYLSNLAAN